MISRVYQMLGIATKAGKTRSGSYLAEDAVRGRKARLVLIAEDAEGNTRKRLEDKCRFYQVPVQYYGTKADLGKSMGQGIRSCVAVTDAGLADRIAMLAEMQREERGNDGEDENQ